MHRVYPSEEHNQIDDLFHEVLGRLHIGAFWLLFQSVRHCSFFSLHWQATVLMRKSALDTSWQDVKHQIH